MNQTKIEQIAEQLWDAQESRSLCAPVREQIIEAADGDDLVATAYAIQSHNTRRLSEIGHRLIGRKIGLTSLAVQKQLGVSSPDFGMLFSHMAIGDGEEIAMSRTLQPKVEAEIALVLGRDLTYEKHTVADLISATEYALPAIEIVGSRISNWDIRLTDTVADNASSGLFVLGTTPRRLGKFDLSGCAMRMDRQGATVSSGTGAACLGNPLNAAVWLADMMVSMGAPLKAGDILMTGALGPMVTVEAGNRFDAEIEGLGKVSAVFSA
ncbi:2-keto-4-pentenoate hydratase [Noviherbaspirillum sp. Root189]|uniref:2-keto-4-pentenoate hydratase n=1 Tax=Noviherbaspirillum sp. Root189 TaxID=1736487 RepID=UPI00070974E8|nr:fumarylacetoacetate hydrolase family protein [Noviherbaspirillum sp. Root189]KRB83478.1 2-keto-4-pentenoate hydratase [Noviherbaspirillum sp. Root189]